MPDYPRIIYWKWDEAILEGSHVEEKIDDLLRRSDFDTVYVSFHWISLPFTDPRLIGAIEKCCNRLNARGKRFVLDIDVRNECEAIKKRCPNDLAYVTKMLEVDLDSEGCASLEVAHPTVGRWGIKAVSPPEFLINAWSLMRTDERHFVASSLCNILKNTSIEGIDSVRSRIVIHAGREHANKTAVLCPAFPQVTVDHFSPAIYEHWKVMFDAVRHIPLGGVGIDEFGYEVVVDFDENYFPVSSYLPYSPHMAEAYEKATGRNLAEDILFFWYAPQGDDGKQIGAINRYLDLLRDGISKNEEWLYDTTKAYFGKDAFVAAHPTWQGHYRYDLYLEVLRNGLDWWSVRRDFAQTDENIILPVRMALSRKTGAAVWYNMFYSGRTKQIDAYFRETWQNARYGGRTHYLGYECPNERNVLAFRPKDLLEQIWEMERVIGELNQFHASQPDARVLVLFGMEAVTNWAISDPGRRVWGNDGRTLHQAMKLANEVFLNGYLCDLVPTSEIVSGHVKIGQNQNLIYGTQEYDAVVLVCPEGMPQRVLHFLREYHAVNPRLIVMGDCHSFSDGRDAGEAFHAFAQGLEFWFPNAIDSDQVTEILGQWKIAGNLYSNGCVFQDGSVIFTSDGDRNAGNPLTVDCMIKGHRVEFRGKDFLAIDLHENGKIQRFASGGTQRFMIDGDEVEIGMAAGSGSAKGI